MKLFLEIKDCLRCQGNHYLELENTKFVEEENSPRKLMVKCPFTGDGLIFTFWPDVKR